MRTQKDDIAPQSLGESHALHLALNVALNVEANETAEG